MPINRIVIALTVSGALLAGGAAALAQSPAPTAAQTIQLSVPLKDAKAKFVDTRPKGPSTGDSGLDYAKLVDPASGAARGVFIQHCDLAKLGKRELTWCAGGLQLAGGELSIALAGVEAGQNSTYAITGGTGAYSTARGTVTFVPGKTAIAVTIDVAA